MEQDKQGKEHYAIAYNDKDGSGFSEHIPWILDDFDADLEECIEAAKAMKAEGFQEVTVFQFGKRPREEYSWKYIRQRIIPVEGL